LDVKYANSRPDIDSLDMERMRLIKLLERALAEEEEELVDLLTSRGTEENAEEDEVGRDLVGDASSDDGVEESMGMELEDKTD
jgi:hypothetical protein